MLIRLLILSAALVLVSLALRLRQRLAGAPPWLIIAHGLVFWTALAYVAGFTAVFLGLHLFGYQL